MVLIPKCTCILKMRLQSIWLIDSWLRFSSKILGFLCKLFFAIQTWQYNFCKMMINKTKFMDPYSAKIPIKASGDQCCDLSCVASSKTFGEQLGHE